MNLEQRKNWIARVRKTFDQVVHQYANLDFPFSSIEKERKEAEELKIRFEIELRLTDSLLNAAEHPSFDFNSYFSLIKTLLRDSEWRATRNYLNFFSLKGEDVTDEQLEQDCKLTQAKGEWTSAIFAKRG